MFEKWRTPWSATTTYTRDRRKRCISPDTMGHPKREVVWEQSLDDQFPLGCHRREAILWQKTSRANIGSQPRRNHIVFTHYPRDPKCEVLWESKNNTSPGVEQNLTSAWSGSHFLRNSETWSRQITKFWTRQHEDTKNTLIEQYNSTNWIQSQSMKTKETSETLSRVHTDFFFRPRTQK